MSRSDRHILMETARAVVNGEPVDWPALTRTHPHLGGRLRNLRLLAGLSDATREEVDALAPGAIWGPLEIRSRVGRGSFGDVYRAHDPVLERDVALKIRRDDDTGLHLDEARRLARVRHPNVLGIHGIETHEGRTGMWTDFLEGRTLESVALEDAPLPERDVVRIGQAVCAALGAVHDAGIVHADVKAANVMLGSDGRPILMDFGAGREGAGASREASKDDVLRPTFGTPLVMAPELLRGAPPAVASDVYAVGVLLYRLACGRYPVEVSTRRELLERLDAAQIPPIDEVRADLSAGVSRAIAAALAVDPTRRPPSARALATRLAGADEVSASEPGSALDTAPVIRGRPVFDTRFVGRAEELRALHERLGPGAWVTLIGPGGSGKTRLAHESASRVAGAHPGGAFWIDLSGVRDADALTLEACDVLDVELTDASSPMNAIMQRIGDAHVLLVLDNAEHVPGETRAFVERVRAACPGATMLVTSRVRLGGEGEGAIDVRPLSVPPKDVVSAAEALEFDATRLFLVRASAARTTFRLTDANAPAVARICRRVDGIPLGIELAAARVGTLGEAELADRLDRSLGLLRDRAGAHRPQHETVRTLIGWSADLLSSPARALLARLSVFAGSFSLVGAEHVCADAAPESTPSDARLTDPTVDPLSSPPAPLVEGEEIADVLTELVEQSLVAFEPGETPRYRMLGLIREYGRERLAAVGDGECHARSWRHHDWYRDLALRVRPELNGGDPAPWLDRLEPEIENLHGALDLPADTDEEILSRLRLLHGISPWWGRRGREHDGIRRARQVHDLREVPGEGALRRSIRTTLGNMTKEIGRLEDAKAELEWATAASRDAKDENGVAIGLVNLAGVHVEMGNLERAKSHLVEAKDVFRKNGYVRGLTHALSMLGVCHERAGDDETAYGLYGEALEVQRASAPDRAALVSILNNLAGSLYRMDRFEEALPVAEEGIALLVGLGDRSQLAASLVTQTAILLSLERLDDARASLLEVTAIHGDIEHPFGLLHMSGTWGSYFAKRDLPEPATIAFSFCRSWAARSGLAISELDRRDVDEQLDRLRAQLGDARFAELERAGRSLDREAFIARVRDAASDRP